MINLYAYTYPSAEKKFDDFILTKFGDSHRDVNLRMKEQGGAAEYEQKITIGAWNNLKKIKRDHDIHKVLTLQGLHHTEGNGTEWFKVPGNNLEDAFAYLDKIVEDLEGKQVRNNVVLRQLQQKALDEAMFIIDNGGDVSTVIANLCPRFGKTIWALMLFNAISEKYGNRVMILPAYWLSVHSSFVKELNRFNDFLDIVHVDASLPDAAHKAKEALENGQRLLITISLHGEFNEWSTKHKWVTYIDNETIFSFADEGDFGTHADNQIKKMEFLFNVC